MAVVYQNETLPVCASCGGFITFDNNDVDGIGSTEATKCEPCGEWFHTNCGSEKHRICQPCIQDCLKRQIDWQAR